MKLPYIQFYTADWLGDTRGLPVAVRGVWIDLICLMNRSPRHGHLLNQAGQAFTDEEISRQLGVTTEEWKGYREQLILTGTCSLAQRAKSRNLLSSRRMISDETRRASTRLRTQGWRKSNRSINSVTPMSHESDAPESESESESESDAADAVAQEQKPAPTPAAPIPIRSTPHEPERDVLARQTVDTVLPHHLRPGNRSRSVSAVEHILANSVDPEGVCSAIVRNHAAWCEYWARERPRFIPMLHIWFESGDYLHPPARAETAAAKKPTAQEELIRELREAEDAEVQRQIDAERLVHR